MSDLPKVQEAVRALEGVARARVTWPDPHGPAQLDISIEPGADEAETTRNVLAILQRVAGVDLDSLDLGAIGPAQPQEGLRPAFVGLAVDRSELDTAVDVTLEVGGRQITGQARGLASYHHSARTAAQATLAALGEVLPPGVRLELEWVEVHGAQGQRPAVVQAAVTILTHAGETVDIGCAFGRGDLRESAVRATLDAVNRRLGALLSAEREVRA